MSLNTELDLDRPLRDVRHETVLNIVRTANLLAQRGTVLFREYDLTEAQFNVLFALKYKDRPVTQSELSRRLVVTRASTTSVLDKLEQKKLVKRHMVPGNRRIHHVELTEKGKAMIETVEPVYRSKVHESLRDCSDEDCRQLSRHLELIRGRLREELDAS